MKRMRFALLLLSFSLYFLPTGSIFAVESSEKVLKPGGADAYTNVSKEGDEDRDDKGNFLKLIFDHTSQSGPTDDKLNTPDFNQDMTQWLELSKQALTSSRMQDNMDDWTRYYDQYMSAQGYICVKDPQGELRKDGTADDNGNLLRSAFLPWLNAMRQNTDILRNLIAPEGGRSINKLKYNAKTVELGDVPTCTSDDPGANLKSESVPSKTWGAFDLLYFLFDLIKNDDGDAAIRTKEPFSQYLSNLVTLSQSDIKSPEDISKYGIADTFRPASMGIVKENEIHGKIPQEGFQLANVTATVDINYELTKAADSAMNFMKCAILPASKQAGLTNNCGSFPAPRDIVPDGKGIPDPEYVPIGGDDAATDDDLSCSDEGLHLNSGGDSACLLCGTEALTTSGEYLTATEKASLPQGDIPELLKQIINSAASTYNVPASMILAMMHEEGSFSRSDWIWTDENVEAWSKCNGEIEGCSSHASSTGAKGPLGWLPSEFAKEAYTGGISNVDSGRTPNSCNVLDSVYATAAALAETAKRNGVTSCSDWDAAFAKTVRKTYAPDADAASLTRTAQWLSAFSCQ